MPAYRLYYLNPKGGIRRAVELDCETDDAAVALVGQHVDGHAMELWDRDRVVRTFPAVGPGAPSDPQD
jgi:hypothetical protein